MDSVKEIISEKNKLTYKVNQSKEITKIILIFNKNNEIKNANINAGVVIGSFENYDNLNELLNLITTLLKNISPDNRINININFTFIVNKKEEEKIVKQVIATLKGYNFNNHNIELTQEYKKTKELEQKLMNQQKLEEKNELLAKGTKEVIKHGPNGEILKYIELDGKIYDNNDYLSINQQKQALLLEWQKDPVKSQEIYGMTPEELDKKLHESVVANKKVHYLNDSSQTNNEGLNQEQKNIANEIAKEYDGKVNEELGIVQKGIDRFNNSTGNEFSIVEENVNGFNIAEPTTNRQTISSEASNNTMSYSTTSNSYKYDVESSNSEVKAESEELTSRELDGQYMYFIDEEDYIYLQEQDIEPIGRIGDEQGYYVDEYNNLFKNNETLGQVAKKNKSKGLTKVRRPDGYIAFLLFSVIMSLMFVIYIVITLI